jgi:hypothetical protein
VSAQRQPGMGARLLGRALEWGVETGARAIAKACESVLDDASKKFEEKRDRINEAKKTVEAWRATELGDAIESEGRKVAKR